MGITDGTGKEMEIKHRWTWSGNRCGNLQLGTGGTGIEKDIPAHL